MKISYAQCLEDYHLDLVLGDEKNGFYIDVGAGHPIADNVSYHFYLKGWSGLIVEPQKNLSRLYPLLRPRDIVIDHLVGAEEGEVNFHIVDRLHGFSTIVEENAQGALAFGAHFMTEKRKIRPLSHLIREKKITKIDFLKIDVEGAEAAVLEGMDWQNVRPKVLCIEAIAPGSMADTSANWEPATLSRGYHFAFSDGLNRFYVSDEEKHLMARFPKSPTPWDVVTHFYEFGRADENKSHPDYALTKRLIKGFLASLPHRNPEEILALLSQTKEDASVRQDDEHSSPLEMQAEAFLVGAAVEKPPLSTILLQQDGAFSDYARAAFGRIAAQFDGGMVHDKEE